jgi:hypothetical protein
VTDTTVDFVVWSEMLKRMSLVQWRVFLKALGQVMTAEYGTVTLVIKKGVVRRVEPAPSIELPDENVDRRPQTIDGGKHE